MSASPLTTQNVYILGGMRTPYGKFGGVFKSITPVDLSVLSSKALIEKEKVNLSDINHYVFANVLPSTSDTLYGARHLALKLGADHSSPGLTVNRLCGSGIQALWEATNQILLGQSSCVLVSGSENMSMAPHLVYGSRFGTKFGSLKTADLLFDTLTDQYTKTPMGITAENLATDYGISRLDCENYSVESHKKAVKAHKDGDLLSQLSQDNLIDENLREDMSLDNIQGLKPSFMKGGVVTPATASGIVDGSSSSLVVSAEYLKKNNKQALAEIIGFSVVGVDPLRMGIGPVPAIRKLLKDHNLNINDIDLFEINEAFASQVLACAKELEIDLGKLNIWGGAIGIGHPLGATGIRIANTLALQLKVLNKTWGIASACIGGGQGIAVLLKNANG